MDTTIEDELLKLSDYIRDIGEIRVEMEKMQNEIDTKKKEFQKLKEKLKTIQEELEIALDELGKKNMQMSNLTKEEEELKKEMKKLEYDIQKLRKEMEKMQIGPMKGKDKQLNQTMGIEKLCKEIEEFQDEFSKKGKEMEKLQKNMEIVKEEQMKALKEFRKKREERDKYMNMDTKQIEKERSKAQEEMIRLGKEIEHTEKETDKKRSELVKLQHGFEALKIWQYDFIDDQIKPRLESGLKEMGSSDVISDSLDDLRLLVLDEKGRGSTNEMLSVHTLCRDPIVKIISTKINIQKSFIERAKVFNLDELDREKSVKIRDDSNVLRLPGLSVETAILEVLNFPDSFPDLANIFVKITAANSSSVDYQVVIKSENNWEWIPTEFQEGYIRCPPRPHMKHFFVVSRGKWRRDTLTPEGLDWKAVDDKNITVKYPPWSVTTKCEIQTQVMHPNPVEQAKTEETQDDIDIENVSPCLWIKADNITQFNKPATVTLPCPSSSSTRNETELRLVEFTDDDDMHISKIIVHVAPQFCEFEIDRPMRTAMVRFKRQITNESKRWKREVTKCYPKVPKECIIVVFSATYVENTICVEIVQSNRLEDLITLRSQQSLLQIKNARSKHLSVRYGEAIIVDALTGIKIPQRYTGDYMQIKFTENDDENNLTFGVDIMNETSSAELAFWLREKLVYVCRFNTELLRERRRPSSPVITDAAAGAAAAKENAFFLKYKTLCGRSLIVLAHQIPVQSVLFLAVALGMSTNDVDDLRAKGNTGRELTLRVLMAWRDQCVHDFSEMIFQLEGALEEVSLNKIASKLKEAANEKRSLETEDFAE